MIDIIIPMYNCIDTIEHTLMSIATQDIKDKFNVILVDDYSEYNYDEFIDKFSRILNINYYRHDKNYGAGKTRQTGIENSSGEYIVFIDSDDLFYSCDSVKKLYEIILSGYDYVESITYDEFLKKNYSSPSDLHGKIYKRKFLEKNNIKFNDTRYHEDNAFNNIILINNPKYIKLEDITYIYCYNKESLTQKDKDKEWERLKIYIENMSYVVSETKNNNCDEKLINKYLDNKYTYLKEIYNKLDIEKKKLLNDWLTYYKFENITD